MTQCEFGNCRESGGLVERLNENNGKVYHYCEDHAPDPTGHNWSLPENAEQ